MNVSDPQHNAQDDEEHGDEDEKKNHVASALTGEVPFARGGRFRDTFVRAVFFHAPDGRFGGFGVDAGRLDCLLQRFRQFSALFGEEALPFRQLPPPGFERVGIVAVPRHEARLSETPAEGNWPEPRGIRFPAQSMRMKKKINDDDEKDPGQAERQG
jgi:hypothetical protein